MDNYNPNLSNTDSQLKMMRDWFVNHPEQRVTANFFFEHFGISKTATRVGEIIAGKMIAPLAIDRSSFRTVTNRFGKKIKVKEYYLPKEALTITNQ